MFYARLLVTRDVIFIINQWDNVKHSSHTKFTLMENGPYFIKIRVNSIWRFIFFKSIIYLAKKTKVMFYNVYKLLGS